MDNSKNECNCPQQSAIQGQEDHFLAHSCFTLLVFFIVMPVKELVQRITVALLFACHVYLLVGVSKVDTILLFE